MIIETKEEMVGLGEKIGGEILEELREGWSEAGSRDVVEVLSEAGSREESGSGMVIELVGDVGAGKTTLAQGIARGLGVAETITSPSFTLSKRYSFVVGSGDGDRVSGERTENEDEANSEGMGNEDGASGENVGGESRANGERVENENGVLVHYDFYRLGDPGIMEEDLAEAMREKNSVVIIEWGESIREILPKKRKTITVKYREDGGREVEIGE